MVIYPIPQTQSAVAVQTPVENSDSSVIEIFTKNEIKGMRVKLPEHTLYDHVEGLTEKLHITTTTAPIQVNESQSDENQEQNLPTILFENQDNQINSLEKQGTESFRSGRYKEALEYLTKIDFNNYTKGEQNKITYLTANAYFQLGEYTKAEEYLHHLTVQRFSPEADDALMLLGMVYKKQNKKDFAIQMFRQVILDFPDSEFYESAKIQNRILSQNTE